MTSQYVIPAPKPKPEPINNNTLVQEFRLRGGHLLHFRPTNISGIRKTRGMTLAFVVKSGHIEIATAVQHRGDDFTKKIGTKTAITHFIDGQTVNIPLRTGRSNLDAIVSDLKNSLGWLV